MGRKGAMPEPILLLIKVMAFLEGKRREDEDEDEDDRISMMKMKRKREGGKEGKGRDLPRSRNCENFSIAPAKTGKLKGKEIQLRKER